jgi:hypothetical protein
MPKYFKVYWVATVGVSIVKADTEEEALNIAGSAGPADKILNEEFWWHDAEPCPDEARELDQDELEAMEIS